MLSYRRIPPNKSYKIFIEVKGTNDCPFQFLQKRYPLPLLYSHYIRFCMVGGLGTTITVYSVQVQPNKQANN